MESKVIPLRWLLACTLLHLWGAFAGAGKVRNLPRMMHELIYYAAQLPTIPGRPRHALLNVSRDTPARLIPASDQAWQPFAPLPTKNSCIIRVTSSDPADYRMERTDAR